MLVAEDPQQAMDELESLLRSRSVTELADILRAVYVEISEETGIDWHFTTLQWKLGHGKCAACLPKPSQARFVVWSLAFQAAISGPQIRYTTTLPFSFRPEWAVPDSRTVGTAT